MEVLLDDPVHLFAAMLIVWLWWANFKSVELLFYMAQTNPEFTPEQQEDAKNITDNGLLLAFLFLASPLLILVTRSGKKPKIGRKK